MRATQLEPGEAEAVRSAMRDVQVSIGDYYRLTAGFVTDPNTYTTPVRACIGFIQKMHEVLGSEIKDAPNYKQHFASRLASGDEGAAVIEAFRYVRNVGQHLLHPITPNSGRIVGSNLGGLGYRTSSVWADIPPVAHSALHKGTQSLRPYFEASVCGRGTLDPLLDACAYFHAACPDAIHRTDEGRWTSFPLRIQWGTSERVHPEEPRYDWKDRPGSELRIRKWLDTRPPGGSFRWICGSAIGATGNALLCGWTFRMLPGPRGFSFLPFWETAEQVTRDSAMGYKYFEGDCGDNIELDPVIDDRAGASFQPLALRAAIEDWATPLAAEAITTAGTNHWPSQDWEQELFTDDRDLTVRRARRMDAWYPIL